MFDEEFKEHKTSISGIPFMGGRPERDHIITDDEIKDLIISLETDTLEQFNARYGMLIA
jgi:hypothetical protein